jgi:hypothetical protein
LLPNTSVVENPHDDDDVEDNQALNAHAATVMAPYVVYGNGDEKKDIEAGQAAGRM